MCAPLPRRSPGRAPRRHLVYNPPVRDRRWDFLYDVHKRPVREVILERFSEELARELEAWPPASAEWASEAAARRFAAGMAGPPRPQVLRLALALARLDLGREHDAFEERMRNEADATCSGKGEREALQLLVVFVTERCLALKEHAEGARLSRADLVRAVELAERRIFRVTLG